VRKEGVRAFRLVCSEAEARGDTRRGGRSSSRGGPFRTKINADFLAVMMKELSWNFLQGKEAVTICGVSEEGLWGEGRIFPTKGMRLKTRTL